MQDSVGSFLIGYEMTADNLQALIESLERLNRLLDGIDRTVHESPEVQRLLALVLEKLDEAEMLQRHGYFTLQQACTPICDLFQEGKPPRIKSFTHCGQVHTYHVLQTYVTC